jgi:hypothetical protein
MSTYEEILEAAGAATRRGLELNAQGAAPDHPDYAAVLPTLHAALAVGWTGADVLRVANRPQ